MRAGDSVFQAGCFFKKDAVRKSPSFQPSSSYAAAFPVSTIFFRLTAALIPPNSPNTVQTAKNVSITRYNMSAAFARPAVISPVSLLSWAFISPPPRSSFLNLISISRSSRCTSLASCQLPACDRPHNPIPRKTTQQYPFTASKSIPYPIR